MGTDHAEVSGFSFGSLICMQLIMRRPEVNNFILLSPQLIIYDFLYLAPCPFIGTSCFIIENDELVTKESILGSIMKLKVKRV